ncbi:MAG: hypothetical protein HY096_00115 [Nitrospinae bacterium]|nr:hypothetical protein [Nitrospinota bacterium]
MSIGLSNARLSVSGSNSEYVPKVKRATPSIAEDAIFIAKPKKRVSFEVVNPVKDGAGAGSGSSNRGKEIPLPGSSSNSGGVQLLGEGGNNNSANNTPVLGEMKKLDTADVTGLSNKIPALGENGVSAKLTGEQYVGNPTEGYVKMKVDYVPQKDHSWDAPQEEGRQINNHQVPFQLQYDSYGRPRIGFSREPYDFAATKYIELTSKIKFNQNVGKTIEHFKQYFLGNGDSNNENTQALFAIANNDSSNPHDLPPLMGAKEDGEKSKNNAEIKLMGDNSGERKVQDGKTGDKKEFEKFFFNNDKKSQEEEIKKVFLGKEISTGNNNEGNTDNKSTATDIFNTQSDSGYKTYQDELASNEKPDTSQFSLKV